MNTVERCATDRSFRGSRQGVVLMTPGTLAGLLHGAGNSSIHALKLVDKIASCPLELGACSAHSQPTGKRVRPTHTINDR